MARRNVTLTLDEDLLRRARHLAVENGMSLSGLLADFLERIVGGGDEYRAAMNRAMRRMRKGFDLGTRGKATWTRGDLHAR